MPIKVGLSDEVKLFLETECFPEELEAFKVCVRLVVKDPIEYSQPYTGPTNAPYMLRWFRFGGCWAMFEYWWTGDVNTDRIQFTVCRRRRPQTET